MLTTKRHPHGCLFINLIVIQLILHFEVVILTFLSSFPTICTKKASWNSIQNAFSFILYILFFYFCEIFKHFLVTFCTLFLPHNSIIKYTYNRKSPIHKGLSFTKFYSFLILGCMKHTNYLSHYAQFCQHKIKNSSYTHPIPSLPIRPTMIG